MLKSFYKSPALRVAAAFAVGGASFSIGSLILARVLSAQDYGLVSLVIGIASVTTLVAALGIDFVVSRNGYLLGSYLRRMVLATSVVTGLATMVVAAILYGLPASLLLCLFVATAAGGISAVMAAHFQGQRRFAFSVPIMQASNLALIMAAALTALAGARTATFPSASLAAIALAIAIASWLLVARQTAGAEPLPKPHGLWAESIPLMTMNAASALFLQLERLVIPTALGINELALFGVLAALVGSPFRMIQGAAGVTLVPRLREASTIEARRQLLRREGALIVSVLLVGSALIWLIAPYVSRLLLAGRYELTNSLMLATIVSGALKVVSAFAIAAASTLAPARSLRLLSLGSWVCVGIAVLASFAASRWGLVGILYGISAGWLVRCAFAGWLSLPYLRHTPTAR
jgi:O-antigen/teichoic acid export membrane protein